MNTKQTKMVEYLTQLATKQLTEFHVNYDVQLTSKDVDTVNGLKQVFVSLMFMRNHKEFKTPLLTDYAYINFVIGRNGGVTYTTNNMRTKKRLTKPYLYNFY